MYDLNKETIARIESLAAKEHRTFEGQLLAMSDLYERTYKIKSDQLKKPISRPPEVAKKRGRPKGSRQSPEAIQKISEAAKKQKDNPRFTGRTHTEEAKRKLSEARKGRKMSEEAKQKMSYSMKLAHARRKIAQLQAQKKAEQQQ